MKHTIYQGNSLERLKEIGDDSVHLTVTSPPYFNAKEYNKEEDNVGNNNCYYDYLESVRKIIKELYEITVPGGIVIWNTSPVIDNGKRHMIPLDTHTLFIEEGFSCRDRIMWVKPDGAAGIRCGGWVVNKGKPMTWHPNLVFEDVMVYLKPGERKQGEYSNIKKYYPDGTPKDLLTDIWKINPETQTRWHDAPYPEELVKRCVLLYSFTGDTVLDPFLGSGTTMKVAKEMGRNSIGIELSPEYIEKAKIKIGFNQKGLFTQEEYEEK